MINVITIFFSVFKAIIPFIFFGLIVGILLLITKKFMAGSLTADGLPYIQKKPLTETEAIFYAKLVEALPECIVLAQVQLSSFIKLKDEARLKKEKKSFSFQNRIAQQSVDYLICKKDFSIISAIELDDLTHDRIKTKKLDVKKSESLDAAGVRLTRFRVENIPDLTLLRNIIINEVSN